MLLLLLLPPPPPNDSERLKTLHVPAFYSQRSHEGKYRCSMLAVLVLVLVAAVLVAAALVVLQIED